jgi:hypothetical protein
MLTSDGYNQWGNVTERLGDTVDAVTAMLAALYNEGLLA